MKEVRIYDQEKYDWALDSALKALSRSVATATFLSP